MSRIVVITDSIGTYREDVAFLADRHDATVHTMHPNLGRSQMRGKLSFLPAILFPNVLRYRRAWKAGDDVLAMCWYLIPILLLIKLRIVSRPRTVVSWGLFVQSRLIRTIAFRIVRMLKIDELLVASPSEFEREILINECRIEPSKVTVLPYRLAHGLPLQPSTGESYIFTGGYTNRDYDTFLAAVADVDFPVEIAATPSNKFSVPIPAHTHVGVEFNPIKFEAQVAGSRVVVIPLGGDGGSSGQSVLIQALQYHKPLIVTRHRAMVEVLGESFSGYVEPGDVEGLRAILVRTLNDPDFEGTLRDESAQRRGEIDGWPTIGEELATLLLSPRSTAPLGSTLVTRPSGPAGNVPVC